MVFHHRPFDEKGINAGNYRLKMKLKAFAVDCLNVSFVNWPLRRIIVIAECQASVEDRSKYVNEFYCVYVIFDENSERFGQISRV